MLCGAGGVSTIVCGRCNLIDECLDDAIERLRLFAVTEMARLVDDVHLGFWVRIGDQFK